MKILLLGHKGYLGSYLYENLKNIDILEKRNVYDNDKKYDYIINCIGKPDLEYCEQFKKETDYSNRDVLKDIIKYYPNSKIINFSSYYVYNSLGFCNEDSDTIKKYNYCRQKLEGEKIVNKYNGISFRIGKLFGNNNIEKQNKLTEYIIKNNNLKLDNILFNPTSLKQVLRIIEYELRNNDLFGIYNLSNKGYCSHYEYGSYINKKLGNIKSIEQINKIERLFDNYGKFLMDTSKLNNKVKLISWKIDVDEYLKELKLIDNKTRYRKTNKIII